MELCEHGDGLLPHPHFDPRFAFNTDRSACFGMSVTLSNICSGFQRH
jgi:hypothetical protein